MYLFLYWTAGNIRLSEFLTEGNYALIASISQMKNSSPDRIFCKIIEVKKSKPSGIRIELSLKDTLYKPGSLLTADIRFFGKNDNPVAPSYSYRLQGTEEEIYSGKDKAKEDGRAIVAIPLPAFQSDDTLKLLVTTSYKGKNIITGIMIPTPENHKNSKVYHNNKVLRNKTNHLNITIRTDKPEYKPDEKVLIDINVTDDQGIPVVAKLSVSASDPVLPSMLLQDDDMRTCLKMKSDKTGKIIARCLSRITQSPGNSFIVQEKNDLEKIKKKHKSREQVRQYGYSADRNISDIIKQIKPYQLVGGKIMFANNGINSINFQDGALIVIDGIKMGTDAGILNSIPVTDIAKINVFTNPSDILRYTGLNSAGIIEIVMKKGPESIEKKEPVPEIKSSALLWAPDIETNSSGNASISFFTNKSSEVLISVEGITDSGLPGSSMIKLSVK